MNRRDFAKTASVATATALSAGRVMGANERVRLGFIGLGNRGDQVLAAFLEHKDCEVAAVCDIYQPYVDFAAKKIGGTPKQFTDYRKLLDAEGPRRGRRSPRPTTGTRCRCVDACAGREGRVRREAAVAVRGRGAGDGRGRPRATSGSCSAASSACRSAFCQGGGRGGARRGHRQGDRGAARSTCRTSGRRGSAARRTRTPPKGFDWDAWLGPAPLRKYNKNRTFYRFRWFYDYSGGQLTNFGVHYLAQIHGVARRRRAEGGCRRSAASSPTTTTARCPTRWRCCGTTPATRW